MYVTHTFDYHVLITHYVCILNNYIIVYSRAVKLAEKLHSTFLPNYYRNLNLKGINSFRKKKAFGFSPEATRGRIEQNITKCTFLQIRARQYEHKFISLYFLADLRYMVHISVFWIKQNI